MKLVVLLISLVACGSPPDPSDGSPPPDSGTPPTDAGPRDAGTDGGSDAGPVCEPRLDTLVAPDFFYLTSVDPIGADHLLFGSRGSQPRVLRRRDGGTFVWAVAVASPELEAADVDAAFGARGAAAPDGSFRVAWATREALTILRGSGEPAVEWSVHFAAPAGESFDPRVAIAVADDGGVIAAASLGGGEFATAGDLLVVALDEHGNALWQRRLAAPLTERVTGLALLPTGEILVLGWSDSFTDQVYEGPFGVPLMRELAWIVTMTRDGAVQSQRGIRAMGETGTKLFLVRPELTHVAAADGSLRIGGSAFTEGGMWGFSRHMWLIAADATGTPITSRLLVDSGGRFSTVVGLVPQPPDRLLVVGETSAGATLTTLSATGTVMRQLALRDVGTSMAGAAGDHTLFAAVAPLCTTDDRGDRDCLTTQPSTILADLGHAAGAIALPSCLAPLRDDSVAAPTVVPVGVLGIDTDAVVSPADLVVTPGSETFVTDDVELGTFCYDGACGSG